MQKFFYQFAGLALLLGLFVTTSCDPTEPPVVLGPEAEFVSESGYLDTDADLQAGEVFNVKVKFSVGDSQLKSVSILEDGSPLATDKFIINNGALTSNNPFLLLGADKDGATYEFAITAHDVVGDITSYTFEVTDDAGKTAETSLSISIIAPPTTELNTFYTAVIINNASGPDKGGYDLDAGVNTSSASTDADFRDRGIDLGAPSNDLNWIQKIEPVNGAVLRMPDFSQIDGFTFDSADNKELLETAWDKGTDMTETTKLAIGDMFMIVQGSGIYLIKVTDVKVTPDDNHDTYTLDIKGYKG